MLINYCSDIKGRRWLLHDNINLPLACGVAMCNEYPKWDIHFHIVIISDVEIDLGLSSLWTILRWLHCLRCVLSNGWITNEMGLNESCSGLVNDLSQNSPEGTEEKHGNPVKIFGVAALFRSMHLPKSIPERYHHTNFLGTTWPFLTKFSVQIMPTDITSDSSYI